MKSSRLIWKILFASYWIVFTAIVVLAYNHALPEFLTKNDKAGHVFLYGLATFLGQMAGNYRTAKFWSWALPLFPLVFSIFTVVEELCQSLSPNRTFDIGDLVASCTGILIGYVLAEMNKPKSV
ncbi:VanZ family protein [Tumidithrix helvetica PCC 7403]|uniref:VanZ family protein n=1 Tax=Tumidithrix helvetica TaxID=3457545 RepID=UPI003C8C51CA